MEITCYRGEEVAREPRNLPAATYNLAVTLLARSHGAALFVPIRAMQVLAILDAEEFVFLDSERRNLIDIAWRDFRPQSRTALDAPVAYTAVYYRPDAGGLMQRLQAEFPLALRQLANKAKPDAPARVLKFPAAPGKSR